MRNSLTDITLYHRYRAGQEPAGLLSERTCEDLNLDDFFLFADRTSSSVGQQFLYDLLRYNRPSEVCDYEAFIRTLSDDKPLRENIQSSLRKLNAPDVCTIASLFSTVHPVCSCRTSIVLRVLQFLPFLFAGLFYLTHSVFFLCLLLIAIIKNLLVHYRNKSKMQGYFFSVPQLLLLLKQADTLTKHPHCLALHASIATTLADLAPLRKRLFDFRLSIKLESDFTLIIFLIKELLNIFFLSEAVSVTHAFSLLHGQQKKIEEVYCFVGLIDTLCSVSQLREELPYYTLPESCRKEELFRAEGLYHPLIENCVSNDLTLHRKSVLITGSNMSGKTSFIRSVGLNLLAANALHTCFARHFCFPVGLQLISAIHLEDSLPEGKSFFLQEVQAIKVMLGQSLQGTHLFLLDELFKGTNTAERIAIGKAVLSVLARCRNLVFVSTHDIELASLLKDEYDLYHFCESIKDDVLSFDYKLKSGPVTERNAIRILEICDYPQEVIREAYATLKANNN